jgi:hypothetical protein
MEREASRLRLLPGDADAVDVPVDPVDRRVIDAQPGATVDPGPPRTRVGDHGVRSGDVARDSAEAGDVERWPVVDAQVHVGSRSVGAPGPAATENYADHPADGGQSAGETNEFVLCDHS